ncbi:hypothetical protein F5Y12DRAFT_6211 [Xylaria sp. FL1777]|nr:hypothetical protein F5Y12DRAFT_6211 [Xylaria sp. FL1777]
MRNPASPFGVHRINTVCHRPPFRSFGQPGLGSHQRSRAFLMNRKKETKKGVGIINPNGTVLVLALGQFLSVMIKPPSSDLIPGRRSMVLAASTSKRGQDFASRHPPQTCMQHIYASDKSPCSRTTGPRTTLVVAPRCYLARTDAACNKLALRWDIRTAGKTSLYIPYGFFCSCNGSFTLQQQIGLPQLVILTRTVHRALSISWPNAAKHAALRGPRPPQSGMKRFIAFT